MVFTSDFGDFFWKKVDVYSYDNFNINFRILTNSDGFDTTFLGE